MALFTFLLGRADAFETVYAFTREHEDWELDELVLAGITSLVCGLVWAAFEIWAAHRRFRDAARARLAAERELGLFRRGNAVAVMAAGLAHSGNNLLQPIITLARVTRRQLGSDHQLSSNLTQIAEAGGMLAALFKATLNFSGGVTRSAGRTDAVALVRDNRFLFEASMTPGVMLVMRIDADAAWVGLSDIDLMDVLIVLLTNAAESYEGESGVVTLSVEAPDDGSAVTVKVHDTGAGVAREDIGRIFDPFFTTKDRGEGSGVGLNVAATLVEQAGGSISVESMKGRGSTFTVTLPKLSPDGPGRVG